MNTYINFMFWLGLLSLIVRSAQMTKNHPRIVSYSLGEDTAALVLETAMFAWVSVLYFGG